jgi:limonene 1,2-monooxygenase
MAAPLRFGVFLAPFHPVPHNPTLSLEQDFQAIEALERLGFDEVWIGEHHSGGLEIISSPEVFIAMAAQRTRRIRLGTGVSSLPYHHPFMLADRMVLLDHLTRGRAMLGCGPGQLVSDAVMMGIDPDEQRRMMGEGLDAVMALLRTRDPVTMETDWFTLRDARLQLANFTHPHMEVAVAGSFSPAGPSHAGRNGVGLISIGATSPQGFALLASHWGVYETEARAHGHAADRARWRLVAPMLLADTDAEARQAARHGYPQITSYLAHMLPTPPSAPRESLDEQIDVANESGAIVIGTADRAVAQIERLVEQSGGFGTVLLNGGYWGDFDATLRSYQIFAERVMPRFNGQGAPPQRSFDFVMGGGHDWRGTTAHAMARAADDYAAVNPAFRPAGGVHSEERR